MAVYERRSPMPVDVEELFQYHRRPGAFLRLLPSWQRARILEEDGDVLGGRLVFVGRMGPLRRRWVAEMRGDAAARTFTDRQVEGPFASWEHTHRFVPAEGGSELIDHVEYELPWGRAADVAARRLVAREVDRLFRFRHARTAFDLARHARWADQPRLTVAVAGSSGLVGSQLVHYLSTAGHRVVRLVRRPAAGPDEVAWDPAAGRLDPAALAGVDAVVNLAGVPISGLWTPARRRAIHESRVAATRTLVAALTATGTGPRVLVNASAVGAYGSRGDASLDETQPFGDGFLAAVCRDWEAAALAAAEHGVRVVLLRLGIVISGAGGALVPLLWLFRSGLGGRLGDGRQWWSWVARDDVLAAVEHALHDEGLSGPVNVTAPRPVTNADFARTLATVLRRPALVPAPRAALRRALGGMADEMLLASQRALPRRLEERGFAFGYPDLEAALRFELGRFR